jgi:hypothetical protein
MVNIDIQANDMNLVVFPDGRNLDAGHQIQRQPARAISRAPPEWPPRIVIGYRQRADAHFNGAMDQFFGCQQPIRGLVWLCKS